VARYARRVRSVPVRSVPLSENFPTTVDIALCAHPWHWWLATLPGLSPRGFLPCTHDGAHLRDSLHPAPLVCDPSQPPCVFLRGWRVRPRPRPRDVSLPRVAPCMPLRRSHAENALVGSVLGDHWRVDSCFRSVPVQPRCDVFGGWGIYTPSESPLYAKMPPSILG